MPSIKDIQEAVGRVVSAYDVREVYLYGSYARGEATQESDIDLRFLCGTTLSFSELLDIQEALEQELEVSLDIATAPPDQMRASLYRHIQHDEVLLYVA